MTWGEYDELAAKMTSGEGSAKVYGTHDHTWQALVTNWAVQDGKHTVVEKDYSFLKPDYAVSYTHLVEVESRPGQGTVFTLTFPARVSEAQKPVLPADAAQR